jgi:uncharacterized protein YndB with AHSA1/START domain
MSDTRAFEMTIEIAVSADAVWQALADPTEVTRWFASRSEIVPGPGGRWMVSWDGNWPWDTQIEIWEPQRHLRLIDRAGRPYDAHGESPVTSVAPMPISLDWYLESKAGSTTLRLVHSGFGRGGAWDDEYEGVSLGWLLELNGLKHYLEHHRGETRQVAWSRTVVAAPAGALWTRFIGPEGILRDASVLRLRAGDSYSTALSTGDRLEGIVIANVEGRGLEVTVQGWNNALYRVWIDRVGAEAAVNSWLSTYGMPDAFAAEFNERMRAEVERVAATAPLV